MKPFFAVVTVFAFLAAFFSFDKAHAQQTAAKKGIPPFKIQLTNMQYLKAAELNKNIPSIIVYFDPTCEHCKTFTADLLKHKNDFAKTQIVMISYTPVAQVKTFEAELNLTKYSNIKIGTEGTTFIVRYFYNVQRFPFVALHDKKGALVATYSEPSNAKELLQRIKKM